MVRLLPLMVLLPVMGCLPTVEETPQVGFDPFGKPASPPVQQRHTANYAPASEEMSRRVDYIGRNILAKNPQIGMKPLFATVGSPDIEIFHKDTTMVWVTAGLVQKCQTEANIAAVLSLELAKMVSEREAQVGLQTRRPDGLPPISMPIGNARYPGDSDLTALAEQGKYEKAHPRTTRRLPPPDPDVLARSYLENAGFPKEQLEAVAPLLRQAEQNYNLEKQFRGIPQGNWRP